MPGRWPWASLEQPRRAAHPCSWAQVRFEINKLVTMQFDTMVNTSMPAALRRASLAQACGASQAHDQARAAAREASPHSTKGELRAGFSCRILRGDGSWLKEFTNFAPFVLRLVQLEGTPERPRLCVFRSLNFIYAQVRPARGFGSMGRLCGTSVARSATC